MNMRCLSGTRITGAKLRPSGKITVKVIPDNQTRIMALESGEIDLIFGKNMIDADAISQYLDSDKFTVGLSDPTSTRHIVMNTTHEILG